MTERAWKKYKSHGCGLGDPLDLSTAAFDAHEDKTTDVVRQHFSNASYFDLLHSDDNVADEPF